MSFLLLLSNSGFRVLSPFPQALPSFPRVLSSFSRVCQVWPVLTLPKMSEHNFEYKPLITEESSELDQYDMKHNRQSRRVSIQSWILMGASVLVLFSVGLSIILARQLHSLQTMIKVNKSSTSDWGKLNEL